MKLFYLFLLIIFLFPNTSQATTYEVGEGLTLENINDVPWESIQAGDTVLIHWRPEPYHEKWVICRVGTEEKKITVRGVPNVEGKLPVIDGRNATTRSRLNFWNEDRGIIKIGGANIPADTLPQYIVIENLDVRSGRTPYTFTGRDGLTQYRDNCAAIYVEKGEHMVIRNCILHDSGNGFFSGGSDIMVEGCYIYDNGIEGSIYHHNNYTSANGIVFQYNRFGPLRDGCLGNNLKDRSAGTVIRYNWIEGGNRQLDLVDSHHQYINNEPSYRSAYVYGNILIELDDGGNSQICHYGGDSGRQEEYRKGTLYFYNNTVISHRSGNTTLLRLSTNDENCDLRNNIIYVTASGNRLALSNSAGTINLQNNWLKEGWKQSHGLLIGKVNNLGNNISGNKPRFYDFVQQKFWLESSSPCIDAGTSLAQEAIDYPVLKEYCIHQKVKPRPIQSDIDIGAYEYSE